MPDFTGHGQPIYYARVQNSGVPELDEIEFVSSHDEMIDGAICAEEDTSSCIRSFTYLDVGAWLNSGRHFGIIHGNGATSTTALCAYDPSRRQAQSDAQDLASRFIERIGCTIVRRIIRHRPQSPIDTSGTLMVLLGDLHLPVASQRYLNEAPPGRLSGLQSTPEAIENVRRFAGGALSIGGLLSAEGRRSLFALITADPQATWLQKYGPADVFGASRQDSGSSAATLNTFLAAVDAFSSGSASTHLYQLGDMYELWIGLQRFFTLNSSESVNLSLPSEFTGALDNRYLDQSLVSRHGLTQSLPNVAKAHVLEWLERVDRATEVTNTIVERVYQAYDPATEEPPEPVAPTTSTARQSLTGRLFDTTYTGKTFLIGNHDCYLKALADQQHPIYVRNRLDRPPGPNNRIAAPPMHYPSVFANGIHMEHGHRDDEYNRYGVLAGHEITQLAFMRPDVRGIQSQLARLTEGSTRPPRLLAGAGEVASWAIANVESERERHIKFAIRTHCEHGDEMKVFAMAHTHAPFMSTIEYIRC